MLNVNEKCDVEFGKKKKFCKSSVANLLRLRVNRLSMKNS